jgi:hypothetical protein
VWRSALVPIIAVILMLFSRRANENGPLFLLGWVLALGIVSTAVYLLADQLGPTTSSSANDSISWGKIVLFLVFGVDLIAKGLVLLS